MYYQRRHYLKIEWEEEGVLPNINSVLCDLLLQVLRLLPADDQLHYQHTENGEVIDSQ